MNYHLKMQFSAEEKAMKCDLKYKKVKKVNLIQIR